MTKDHRKEHTVDPRTLVLIEEYGGLQEGTTAALPTVGRQGYKPESDLQALMEAPPGAEPEESQEGHDLKVEALRGLLEGDALEEREAWIIHGFHWRRLSLSQIGEELSLSKSHVHRILKEAEQKLGGLLTGAANEEPLHFENTDEHEEGQ